MSDWLIILIGIGITLLVTAVVTVVVIWFYERKED